MYHDEAQEDYATAACILAFRTSSPVSETPIPRLMYSGVVWTTLEVRLGYTVDVPRGDVTLTGSTSKGRVQYCENMVTCPGHRRGAEK